MDIKIGKFTLKSDKFSAWIEQDYKVIEGKNKGKVEPRRVTGYHRDFGRLLDDFIETKVKDSETQNVEEVIAIIDKALKEAKQIARAATKGDFKIVRNKESEGK